jgi:hypothetical protein
MKPIFFKFKTLTYIASFLFVTFACTPQRKIAGNYNTYKTECLGVEGDGTQTLLTWGQGRNRFDAVEQAKKNAVRDVIFKGINYGKGACEVRPIVSEVNAEQKYEDYFVKFFADKGPYLSFVSMKDERIDDKITRDRQGASKDVTNSVVVMVNRYALKQRLTENNILKP